MPCPLPPITVPKESSVLPLIKTEARVRVVGIIAEVEVVQHYHNPSRKPIDVGYTFPLPGNAAVRAVDMVTGGRTLSADLRELEEAKAIYEDARKAGHGALLVESRRENVFRARIANVDPGQELAVRIRYAQVIEPSEMSCRFLFPTVVAPRYCPAGTEDAQIFDLPYVPSGLPGHSIAIDLEIDAGAPIERVSSPSHPISVSMRDGRTIVGLGKSVETPNRDFILSWTVVPGADGLPDSSTRENYSATSMPVSTTDAITTDATLTKASPAQEPTPQAPPQKVNATLWTGPRSDFGIPFLLVAWPPRTVAIETRTDREIIFILDSSGSMSGPKFEVAKRALRGFLRGLSSRDTIRLIEFDDDFTEMSTRAMSFSQATLDRADAWIDALAADGGTEIFQPLSHALKLPSDAERDRIIVLLTDGQVGNEEEVLAEVTRRSGRTRIYTLGIDYAVNDEMLRSIARVAHGSCILISPDEDVEGAILSLRKRFTTPIATKIELSMSGSTTTYPDQLPDLHAGEPLIVYGRATSGDMRRARLKGRSGGKPWSLDLDLRRLTAANVNLAAAIAEKEIESLTDKMHSGDGNQLKRKIIATSLAHGVASVFTGFVVVDRREEKTDTGAVRTVEVPVAFPQGWNWNTVLGQDRDAARSMPKYYAMGGAGSTRSRAYGGSAAGVAMSPHPMRMAYIPAPSVAYDAGIDGSMAGWSGSAVSGVSGYSPSIAASPQEANIAPIELAIRYLARNQRASGMWMRSGREDIRTTSLALLALLPSYSSFQFECDRAIEALLSDARINEAVSSHDRIRALVQLALKNAANVVKSTNASQADACRKAAGKMGQVPVVTDASSLTRLAQSDDADDLSDLLIATRASSSVASAAHHAATAAARLSAHMQLSGADAGQVNLPGTDPIEVASLYAALDQAR